MAATVDLRARLDAAITAARNDVECEFIGQNGLTETCVDWSALDRYTALVELRARWDEHAEAHTPILGQRICTRCDEIEADVRRLLEGDHAST